MLRERRKAPGSGFSGIPTSDPIKLSQIRGARLCCRGGGWRFSENLHAATATQQPVIASRLTLERAAHKAFH